MKKVFLSVLCVFVAGIAMAQLEVRSNGAVVFPGSVIAYDGNLLFPGGQDIRFGGDTAGANSKWAVEYYGGGLNFWKPDNPAGYKDYLVFLKIMGKLVSGEATIILKRFLM